MKSTKKQYCSADVRSLFDRFSQVWGKSQGKYSLERVRSYGLILVTLVIVASGLLFGCGGGSSQAAPPAQPSAPPVLPAASTLPASCTAAATIGAYNCQIAVSSGKSPFTWKANSLPRGLALTVSADTTTATISGTVQGQVATTTLSSIVPYAATASASTTTASVQITVTDSTGQSASLTFSITLTISPLALNTSPLPGATLGSAYSATVTASGGLQPYAWSVTAGSLPPGLNLGAASGTISGTPLATGTFVFTLQVSDAESTAATLSSGFAITVSTSSTVNCTGVNFSITLCGTYVFGVGGFVGTTGPAAFGASFVADNAGHIVSGVEDFNSVSGGQANVAITGGTYTVSADGRGVLTVIDSNGVTRTFRFVLESTNNPGIAAIEEFDASGTLAAGILDGPSTPAGAIPPNTPFAVQLGGVNGAGKRAGMLGEFEVGSSGCNGAAGSLNPLTGETVVINVSGAVSTATFTGSCTAPDPKTGRGTATITLSSSPFTNTTLNFVFYAVSILDKKGAVVGTAMLLGEADAIAANQPILGGLAQQVSIPVTGGLTNCGAPAACILAGVGTTDGTIAGHNVALLVRAVATGTTTSGTIAGILDENFGGTITSGAWPYTAYTTDANGVGTITGTGQPTIHFVADGRFMDESVSVITGDANVQNATTIEKPGAPYIIGESIGTSAVGATPVVPHVVGVITPSGAAAGPGTFSGTVDVSSLGGSVPGAAGTGTYGAIEPTTGRATGTADLTGSGVSIKIVIYANRGRRFSVLDVQPGDTDPVLLGARLQ